MKKVTIPTCANPFVVIVNGIKYTYPAGETVEVPDDVAAVIEQHHDAHNNPQPEPVVPPFTPATGGGESGGNVTDSQIDARVEAFWTNAALLDFTKEFDFAESIMQGGAMVEKTLDFEGLNMGAYIVSLFERGPAKIKVSLNGMEATLFVFAQNFGTHSQFTDFVVYDDHLLYLFLQVTIEGSLRFQCKEVPTSPYVPS